MGTYFVTPHFSKFETFAEYNDYKNKCLNPSEEKIFPKIEFPHLVHFTSASATPKTLLEERAIPFNGGNMPVRINPYLYGIEYDHINYEYGEEYIKETFDAIGACTSVRKGNFYGRNFDWFYDESISFVIKVNAHCGRYASIGITGGLSGIDKPKMEEIIDNNGYSNSFNVLPSLLLDGINEKGVFCNHNITTTEGYPEYVPENRKGINALMVPRFIVDNFASAKDVKKYFEDNVIVYQFASGHGSHFMFGDDKETYIMEFDDKGWPHCLRCKEDDKQHMPIMTNFNHMGKDGNGVHFNDETGLIDAGEGTIAAEGTNLTDYACGVERYNLIVNKYGAVKTFDDMYNLMTENLCYTKAYKRKTNPFWYSEFVGNGITVYSEKTALDDYIDNHAIPQFNKEHDKSSEDYRGGQTWETVHTTVYDIEKRKLTVLCQEGEDRCGTPKEYDLNTSFKPQSI